MNDPDPRTFASAAPARTLPSGGFLPRNASE
jgi:hypothetical protein